MLRRWKFEKVNREQKRLKGTDVKTIVELHPTLEHAKPSR